MVVVSDFLKDNLFCLLSIKTKWRGRYWSILILPRVDLVSSFFQMLTQVKLTTAQSSLPFFCPTKQSGFCFLISVCLKYSTISKVLWILSLEFFLHILILHNTLLQTIISSPLQMSIWFIFWKHQFHPVLVYLKIKRSFMIFHKQPYYLWLSIIWLSLLVQPYFPPLCILCLTYKPSCELSIWNDVS